jgi:micrococcal nuclease
MIIKPFIYNAIVDRVVDGDTVDVHLDLGFDTWIMNQRIRLMGVDTPECRTRDDLEKQFGFLAKSIVEGFCPVGEKILIETVYDNDDKFGRVLGTLWVNSGELNLNQFLIDERYAVAYEGQSKDLIEEAHLANFAYLTENGKI